MQELRGQMQEGRKRIEFAVCLSLLAILALALLWPAIRHWWWLWKPGAEHSDLAVTHWPNAHFTRRVLWDEGRFPVWRPTIMSGTPFAANPLAGLYYPPNWLFLFLPWLPLEVGFNLSALAHLWLAGAAMYILMRHHFGTGVWGSLMAAVAYEASPKLLAHLGAGHVGWVQAWGWLPVVVLCHLETLRRAWGQERGSAKQKAGSKKPETGDKKQESEDHEYTPPAWQSAIYAGAALALQFCADVRMAAYTLIGSSWLMAVHCWKPDTARRRLERARSRTWVLGLWASSLVVFVGLSACQWLPLAALLPQTTRASMTLADAANWSLPWRYLLGLLLADHGGFHEWMTYVGVGTLVLAGAGAPGVWRKQGKRWLAVGLTSLLLGSAWFSLGENGGLFAVLWRAVPGLGLLRVPPRAWVLVVFSAAALAGLGVEEIRGREMGRAGKPKLWRLAPLLAVGVFPVMLLGGYWLLMGTPPLNLAMFGLVTPLAVALVGFKSQVSRLQSRANLRPETLKPETILHLAAVLLVAADLLVADGTLIEARSSEEVFAEGREAAEWLAKKPGRFRIYSPSYSIPQHVAELYELDLADGVDPLQLRIYADYLTRATGAEPQGYSVTLPPFPKGSNIHTALKDVVPDAEALGLLGVRYVASAFPIVDPDLQLVNRFDGVYVYRNANAQTMASIQPSSSIVLSDGTTLFRYQPGPLYAGWTVSTITLVGLLVSWLASQPRRRRIDA